MWDVMSSSYNPCHRYLYLCDEGHDERRDGGRDTKGGRDAKVVRRRRGGLRPRLGLVPTIIQSAAICIRLTIIHFASI